MLIRPPRCIQSCRDFQEKSSRKITLAVPIEVQYNPTMFENENNSTNLFNETSNKLTELDAAFTDPFVEGVLETGRTYNKIFQEATPSAEEASLIIDELDTEWGNIRNSEIHYTGMIKVADLHNEGEVQQVFLDGARVVSNGFCIERGDIESGEPYKVRHHLIVKFSDAYGIDSDDQKDMITRATGDIDSSLIELDSASSERAKAWLTLSCPELIEEVDFRVLNATGDESGALLSLQGLDFNRYADLNDLFTRNCLNVYLQDIIEIDTTAPYSANINGYARMAEDQDTLYHLKVDTALVDMSTIGMQQSFNLNEGDTDWSLSAFISILGTSRNDAAQNYILPVDSIQTMQSIRTAYYEENN